MTSTRRQFLGILGALAASRLGLVQTRGEQCRFVLNECFVAGFRYHEGPDIMRELHVGDEVQLVAEPGNPYDPWAVRIEHRKTHIGYLPRTQNEAISRLLQQGVLVACGITAVQQNAVPWEAVRVQASILMDAVTNPKLGGQVVIGGQGRRAGA